MLDLATAFDAPTLPGDPRPGTRPLERSALGVLGIEVVAADADRVVMRMPSPTAGATAVLHVLAESLASTGAGIAAGTGRRAFGTHLESTMIAQPCGDVVVGVASPLLVDAQRQVWQIDVRDRTGERCLVGRCILSVLPDPGD